MKTLSQRDYTSFIPPCWWQELLRPAEWKREFWTRRMRSARINRTNFQYVRNGELNYSNTWVKNITNYHNQPIQHKQYHIPIRYHHQDTSLWFASAVLRRVWRNLPSSPPWSPGKNPRNQCPIAKVSELFLLVHPGRLTWTIIREVWKIIFLSKWVMCRFHFSSQKNSLKAMNVFVWCFFSVASAGPALATAFWFTPTKKYIYIDANICILSMNMSVYTYIFTKTVYIPSMTNIPS